MRLQGLITKHTNDTKGDGLVAASFLVLLVAKPPQVDEGFFNGVAFVLRHGSPHFYATKL